MRVTTLLFPDTPQGAMSSLFLRPLVKFILAGTVRRYEIAFKQELVFQQARRDPSFVCSSEMCIEREGGPAKSHDYSQQQPHHKHRDQCPTSPAFSPDSDGNCTSHLVRQHAPACLWGEDFADLLYRGEIAIRSAASSAYAIELQKRICRPRSSSQVVDGRTGAQLRGRYPRMVVRKAFAYAPELGTAL